VATLSSSTGGEYDYICAFPPTKTNDQNAELVAKGFFKPTAEAASCTAKECTLNSPLTAVTDTSYQATLKDLIWTTLSNTDTGEPQAQAKGAGEKQYFLENHMSGLAQRGDDEDGTCDRRPNRQVCRSTCKAGYKIWNPVSGEEDRNSVWFQCRFDDNYKDEGVFIPVSWTSGREQESKDKTMLPPESITMLTATECSDRARFPLLTSRLRNLAEADTVTDTEDLVSSRSLQVSSQLNHPFGCHPVCLAPKCGKLRNFRKKFIRNVLLEFHENFREQCMHF
jgi:hypothetical protein